MKLKVENALILVWKLFVETVFAWAHLRVWLPKQLKWLCTVLALKITALDVGKFFANDFSLTRKTEKRMMNSWEITKKEKIKVEHIHEKPTKTHHRNVFVYVHRAPAHTTIKWFICSHPNEWKKERKNGESIEINLHYIWWLLKINHLRGECGPLSHFGYILDSIVRFVCDDRHRRTKGRIQKCSYMWRMIYVEKRSQNDYLNGFRTQIQQIHHAVHSFCPNHS